MNKTFIILTSFGVLIAVLLGLYVTGHLNAPASITSHTLTTHAQEAKAALTPQSSSFIRGAFGVFIILAVLATLLFRAGGSSPLKQNKSKHNRPVRSASNELGSGDLARKSHIAPWLERQNTFDTLIPVHNLKGSDGIVLRDGNLVIPLHERNRHILTIAKTGSGKTSRMILPILYGDCMCPERTTIVIDSKPEMWQKLAAMTRKYNPKKNIMLFNPLDAARSLSWNILSKIENDTDCKLIANTLIMATDNPASRADSPFFRNNALQILNSIMVGLLNDKEETLSMPRIHELVQSGMSNLCDWLEARPDALRNTKTFVDLARSGSQNADTIMSELSMRLGAWDLQTIRATTSESELDIETLISQPTLFIIELRESELEMLRPLANVIVIELLRFLTKRAEQYPAGSLPRPASLVIDEFASALGRLPDIHVKLNTLRSRNVSIVAAIQSIAQIKANYERDADSVLAGFSTKILMPALDFQDSEWASKETGTMTVRYNTSQLGKNKRIIDVFSNKNDSVSEQVQQRAVLTPDEIGRPIDNVATFFLPNTPVFQGHLVPYFEIEEMKSRFKTTSTDDLELKLREKPIVYSEILSPLNGSADATNHATREELLNQLEEDKVQLGWLDTQGAAREWWIAFEEANKQNLSVILGLTKDLLRRTATITDFYKTYARSGLSSVEEVLGQLDRETFEKTKRKLGWETLTGPAHDWWLAFEEANKNNVPLMLSLSLDLAARNATIAEFFAAYVYSDTDDVEKVLHYLDYLKLEAKSPRPSTEDIFPLSEQIPTNINSTPKEAARNVHLISYLEMARTIVTKGKKQELASLLLLAEEDKLLTLEDRTQLKQFTDQHI